MVCLQAHGVSHAVQAVDFVLNGNDMQHRVANGGVRVTGGDQLGHFAVAHGALRPETGDLCLGVEALDGLTGNCGVDVRWDVAAKVTVGLVYGRLQCNLHLLGVPHLAFGISCGGDVTHSGDLQGVAVRKSGDQDASLGGTYVYCCVKGVASHGPSSLLLPHRLGHRFARAIFLRPACGRYDCEGWLAPPSLME